MVDTKKSINMIAGVSEVLRYKKRNPQASEEEIMAHIMDFLRNEQFENSKIEMIAAASYCIKLIEREPDIKDRIIITKIMEDLKNIMPKE